jgi:hypothetical protein
VPDVNENNDDPSVVRPPAIRPSAPLGIAPGSSRGARGMLASPQGEVSCELEALAADERSAPYELRVRNGTPNVLAATAYAVRSEDGRPVAALAVEVLPHAAVRTGFTLDATLTYDRVAAEVRGEGVHLVVEAAPPRPARPRRRWVTPAVAVGCGALLAGATLVGYAAARPAVVSAALVASPGGELIGQWTTRGGGTRTYELRNAAGDVTARGTLPVADGQLSLGRGDAATFHVAIANAFGSDARDAAYARATPPPAVRIVTTPPPRIASVTIDPPQPGAPLRVRYAAIRATGVRLAVVDRTGATWFATTVAPGNGEVRIPAPPADGRQPYALIASTTSGRDELRVPVPTAVTPQPSPSASAPIVVASVLPESGPALDTSGVTGELLVAPDVVQPGQTVAVQLPYPDAAHVALIRENDGVEVASVDVARGARRTTLTVPVRGSGPYAVRATIARGIGSITLLHHLTLRVR